MDEATAQEYQERFARTLAYLKTKKRALFLTTSTRWSKEKNHEMPKSTALAYAYADALGTEKATVMEIPNLNMYACEGNVSTARGNLCGVRGAQLKDAAKNPGGQLRCWASVNNPDDELWKVSTALFESDCVVFFGSIRWGQMNAEYQKLIERLTWIENRHSTLGEENIVGSIDVGVIAVGHNWRGAEVVATQKQVLSFFGFNVVDALCWNWEFTTPEDESQQSYRADAKQFQELLLKK